MFNIVYDTRNSKNKSVSFLLSCILSKIFIILNILSIAKITYNIIIIIIYPCSLCATMSLYIT